MKRSLILGIVIGGVLAASAVLAQEVSQRPMLCPHPTYETLTASGSSVVNADFSAAALAAPRAGLNDSQPNKMFLYSFVWKPSGKCCTIVGATLTVKMMSNQPGSSKTASDAGNDLIGITRNGAGVPGYAGPVYTSFPFPANQATTKTYVLTGAELANLNADNRLSFNVEDDTRVTSATLSLARCCLN